MKTTNRAKRNRPKMLCCCGASARQMAIKMSISKISHHRGALDLDLTLLYMHIGLISSISPFFRPIDLSKILIMHLMLQIENWEFHDFSTPKIWLSRVDQTNGTEDFQNWYSKLISPISSHSYPVSYGAYLIITFSFSLISFHLLKLIRVTSPFFISHFFS